MKEVKEQLISFIQFVSLFFLDCLALETAAFKLYGHTYGEEGWNWQQIAHQNDV